MPTVNQANSREERLYLLAEATYGTAQSPPLATDAVLFERFRINNTPQTIVRRDKTGSRGQRPGIKGRDTCTWSYDGSLVPNPAAATKPPLDVLLTAGMGVGTVGGSDVSYTLASAIKSMTAFSYRTPSTISQRCGVGLVVGSMQFAIGSDYLTISASGEGKYLIYSDLLAGLDANHQCGLTTFPAEPGTTDYTDDGGIVVGFTGSCLVGGNTLASLRNASSRISTGNATRKDTFGTWMPDGSEGAMRTASTSFTLYDTDGAESTAIRQAADTKTPVTVLITVGFASGKKWEFTHNNVILSPFALDDGSIRWSANIAESGAAETTPGASDEYKIRVF